METGEKNTGKVEQRSPTGFTGLLSTGMCVYAGINGCKVKVFNAYDGVFVCITCACVFLFARDPVFEETHVEWNLLLRDLAGI